MCGDRFSINPTDGPLLEHPRSASSHRLLAPDLSLSLAPCRCVLNRGARWPGCQGPQIVGPLAEKSLWEGSWSSSVPGSGRHERGGGHSKGPSKNLSSQGIDGKMSLATAL